jgi:hypothetical protein
MHGRIVPDRVRPRLPLSFGTMRQMTFKVRRFMSACVAPGVQRPAVLRTRDIGSSALVPTRDFTVSCPAPIAESENFLPWSKNLVTDPDLER